MRNKRQNVIMGNAKVVRSINRAAILNIIREQQPISRIQIARITGLNKSTVTSIVPELVEEKLVYEAVDRDKNVGRNPISLRLQSGTHFVGGISIEAKNTHLVVADIDGSIKAKETVKTRAADPADFLADCARRLTDLRVSQNVSAFKSLGICLPGVVDPQNGTVFFSPQLGWENLDLAGKMQTLMPEQDAIVVDNDANASALAELWFAKHDKPLQDFVFLQVENGIGAGIVLEKELVRGGNFASGEFGHLTIYEGGELCACGNYGCWEAYASVGATLKRYQLRSVSREKPDGLQSIVAEARQGDEIAREVLLQTGQYLGLGIANIIKAVDPHVIVLSGGIVEAFDLIYPEMMATVNRRAFWGRKREIKILPTALAVEPRVLGAATLAIQELFNDFRITR